MSVLMPITIIVQETYKEMIASQTGRQCYKRPSGLIYSLRKAMSLTLRHCQYLQDQQKSILRVI